jgi:tetratricopeptide (TPR) repeat protein
MKKIFWQISLLWAIILAGGCEFLDVTEAEPNPNLTQDNILQTNNPMTPWVNGMERQMAVVYNNMVTELEVVSDNYDNTASFYNQNFDVPDINYADGDVDDLLFVLADLRESALFGINTVAEADPEATDNQVAEMYFFLGWAHLLSGEIFVAVPAEAAGPAVEPAQHFQLAIQAFQDALALTTDAEKQVSYQLALARAYYGSGDKAAAVSAANAVLAADSDFTRFVEFDGVNGPASTIQDAIYDRTNLFDLQPLPRLDFLDPKFHGLDATSQVDLPFQKAEEAYLILAEAAIADNNLDAAKGYMLNLLDLVATRPVQAVPETDPRRNNGGAGEQRPNSDEIEVRASASDPYREGLLLNRVKGDATSILVTVPTISGTSVTADMINALSTQDAALETLYLMRQEIFFAEGRRMFDLGIRFAVSRDEVIQNDNILEDSPFIESFVPDFIPGNSEMDAYLFEASNNQVTILHNMNKVIVNNKNAAVVVPFL